MFIIPAVNILDGKAVESRQCKFELMSVYDNNPVSFLKDVVKNDVEMVHIVDTNGARDGEMKNFEMIKKIRKSLDVVISIGGGVRNKGTIKRLLNIGIDRIVIGTRAHEDKQFLKDAIAMLNDRLIISLDSRGSILTTHGFIKNTQKNIINVAKKLEKVGVERILYIDAFKDAVLQSPNYEVLKKLVSSVNIPVLNGGGVASLDDLIHLKEIGIEGTMVGRSLREKRIDLNKAISIVR